MRGEGKETENELEKMFTLPDIILTLVDMPHLDG